jgi:hypothetical protein
LRRICEAICMTYKVTQTAKPKLFPSHYRMMFDATKTRDTQYIKHPTRHMFSQKKKKRGKETESPHQCDTTFDPSDRKTEQRETQIASLAIDTLIHLPPRTHSTPPNPSESHPMRRHSPFGFGGVCSALSRTRFGISLYGVAVPLSPGLLNGLFCHFSTSARKSSNSF